MLIKYFLKDTFHNDLTKTSTPLPPPLPPIQTPPLFAHLTPGAVIAFSETGDIRECASVTFIASIAHLLAAKHKTHLHVRGGPVMPTH